MAQLDLFISDLIDQTEREMYISPNSEANSGEFLETWRNENNTYIDGMRLSSYTEKHHIIILKKYCYTYDKDIRAWVPKAPKNWRIYGLVNSRFEKMIKYFNV